MKKIAVAISLLIMLCPVVLFAEIDESQSKPILVLDEPNNVLSAKTDSNNSTKSQAQLDAQLIEAVENVEDFNSIKQALDSGANPNCTNPNSSSLIFKLIWSQAKSPEKKEDKCLRALNILFDSGAKLQWWCDNEILLIPITKGFPKVVSLLIDKGVDPNKTTGGRSPVELAEYYGQTEVVSVLIKRGATPISRREAAQLRLVKCSCDGDISGIELAIQNGALINEKIKTGETALTEAVNSADVFPEHAIVTIAYLLKKGADPDIAGEHGDKPLHRAMFSTFAQLGFDANNLPPSKQLIEEQASCKLIIEALLQAGAKVSSRNKHEQTPLHIAAKWNNLWGARKLIESGAKLMDRDDSGKTPLDYAESAEMIKLLKSHGATEQ